MNITIPEALAREIAANPERFRPRIEPGQRVLALATDDPTWTVGWVGRWKNYGPILASTSGQAWRPWIELHAEDDEPRDEADATAPCVVTAWALVGSVEEPATEPRPVKGDRVLVIKADLGSQFIAGSIGTVSHVPQPQPCGHFHQPDDWSGTPGAILVDFDPGIPFSSSGVTTSCRVTRWAILPPAEAPAPDPVACAEFDRPGELAWVEKKWSAVPRPSHELRINGMVVGTVKTAEMAAAVVEAMNGPGAEIARLNLLLAEVSRERDVAVADADRLTIEVADVTSERDELTEFQNSIATRIPEQYEASEGSQESCIDNWLNDVTVGRWALSTDDMSAMVSRMFRHMGYTDEQIDAAGSAPAHTPECEFDSNSYRWDCANEDGKSNHPLKDEINTQAELLMVALGYDGDPPTDIDPLQKLQEHKAQVLQSFYEDLIQAGFDDEAVLGILERRIARAKGNDPEAGGQDG